MSDEARGFPAFPAPAGRRSTSGRSWWGRAWVQAFEDTSLDADQLRKGRRFANSGQVGTITISPGRIAATVYAAADTYEAIVLIDRLSDDDWQRFLAQVGSRAGHIAALLDGEMPHDLVEAAADAGVSLLPGIGDLDPSCTCDAWELPCQHAAALCYQVGWLLDEDPFVLLLMRGHTRERLLDDLVNTSSQTEDVADEGVTAEVGSGEVRELPAVPEVPGKVRVEELAISGVEAPPELGARVLSLLVVDAARRARAQLAAVLGGAPDPWVLDEWQDAVRLASDFPELTEALASATGRQDALSLGVQAWTYGGAPGLEVLETTWQPDPSELARARTELLAASDDPETVELRTDGNRLTDTADPTRQLRLDRLGRWHPYQLVDTTWTPAGPADRDPTAAFST